MNEDNKKRMKWGLDVLACIIAALVVIAVCAGVWNYCPEPFIKVLAVVLFLADGYLIYRFAKLIRNSNL